MNRHGGTEEEHTREQKIRYLWNTDTSRVGSTSGMIYLFLSSIANWTDTEPIPTWLRLPQSCDRLASARSKKSIDQQPLLINPAWIRMEGPMLRLMIGDRKGRDRTFQPTTVK